MRSQPRAPGRPGLPADSRPGPRVARRRYQAPSLRLFGLRGQRRSVRKKTSKLQKSRHKENEEMGRRTIGGNGEQCGTHRQHWKPTPESQQREWQTPGPHPEGRGEKDASEATSGSLAASLII